MQLTSAVSLRPAGTADESFLRAVFRSGRPELAGLPVPLIELQQQAQRSQYDTAFPGHTDFIIVLGAIGSDDPPSDDPVCAVDVGAVDVGRCWLWRSETEQRLLDLVVLPAYRGRGVGRSVLTHLAAAADVPLRLSVWSGNPAAIRLYRSIGFEQYDEQQGYLFLQLLPSMAG